MSGPHWYISPDARWRLGILVLVVLAIPLRMHGLDRSLWLDETWVANSVLEPELAAVFYYDTWLQTTPPVFLLLERLVVDIIPLSNIAFRLLPFAFGVLGVALTAYLALRLLRPPIAFVAIAMLTLSPHHIVYSQSLKQFTGDLFVACLMTFVGLFYLQRRSTARLIGAIMVFLVLAGLSYNAILFTPALLYGALIEPPTASWRWPRLTVRFSHVLAIAAAVAGAAAINYLFFIRPNLGISILGGPEKAARSWYEAADPEKALNVLRIFKHFFFDPAWSGPLYAVFVFAAATFALIGLVYLVARGHRGRPKNLDKAALLTLPVLGTSGLDFIGYYPLESMRLSLFLMPSTLLLFGFGLQTLLAWGRLAPQGNVVAGMARRRALVPGTLVATLAGLLTFRIIAVDPAPYLTWQLGSDENTEAAVAHLAAVADEGDVLYVDTSMLEPFRFYRRFAPMQDLDLVEGRIAWPCCPRDVVVRRSKDPEREAASEGDRILEHGGETLWVLSTGRDYRWEVAGAKFPDLLAERIEARGCVRMTSPTFDGVRLDRYTCPRHRRLRDGSALPGSLER